MAAQRILHDPNLSIQPDFTSPAYNTLCNAISQVEGIKMAEAAERMAAAWTIDQNARIKAWNHQVEADEAAAAAAPAPQAESLQPPHQPEPQPPPKPAHDNPPPPAKQKSKLRPFQANKPVAAESAPRPSRYAIHKLEEQEYVELYYFTPEACAEAENHDRTMSKIDETIAFKPMAAHKVSNKVISDKHLSWKQMTLARNTLLQQMGENGWPDDYVFVLATFFLRLENHRFRWRPNGEQALLNYQAQVRREWHDALRNTTSNEPVFDISVINEQRLERIATELLNDRQTAGVLRLEETIAQLSNHGSPDRQKRRHFNQGRNNDLPSPITSRMNRRQRRSSPPPPRYATKNKSPTRDYKRQKNDTTTNNYFH